MNCPKCKKANFKDYCMFCGYMTNGNYVKKTIKEVSDLEIMLGYEYNDIIHNNKKLKLFLLGPLYLCYRNCFTTGFFLEISNILFICFNTYIGSLINLNFSNLSIFFFFSSIIIEKVFWMAFANQIYIKITKIKLKNWKKKYSQDEYKIKIENQKIKNFLLPILSVLLLLFILFIIVFIYRYYKKL